MYIYIYVSIISLSLCIYIYIYIRIKPGRIKRAALSLQSQHYCILCFLIRPRLYASERRVAGGAQAKPPARSPFFVSF